MNDCKYTKTILKGIKQSQKRVPLFNPAAVDIIDAEFNEWFNHSVGEKNKINWEVVPHNTVSGSEIPKKYVYSPLDIEDLDYMQDLGFSGGEPFTRGFHANMYRERKFTASFLSGAGLPVETNRQYKFLIERGAIDLSVSLDLPSIQMYDSDEPESNGNVAVVGVPVDCVQDWDEIFEGIPIDKITVSLNTHFPQNTAILFSMYLAMAKKKNIQWNQLLGSVPNDFIMESVVRGASEYIPPKDCFRVQCDNIEFIRKEVPQWNCIILNGYNLREYGTTGITEVAVAMANGIAIIEDMKRRGYDADWIEDRITFKFSFGNDFFEEIARIRAARRLWYKIMKYKLGAKNTKSMQLRCITQTSSVSLTREEPLNNITRAAYHALSAVLGGTQSLQVDTYDEAFSVPSESSIKQSIRTQQIIECESQCTLTHDPMAGSFYVEALTNDIEERILNEIDEIEQIGGIVAAVESGWLHSKVVSFNERELQQIEKGEKKVVAYNVYKRPDGEIPPIHVSLYKDKEAAAMITKLKQLRTNRDNSKVKKSLKALINACKQGDNVTYYCVEAACANATQGEMRKAFIEAFGLWKPQL